MICSTMYGITANFKSIYNITDDQFLYQLVFKNFIDDKSVTEHVIHSFIDNVIIDHGIPLSDKAN